MNISSIVPAILSALDPETHTRKQTGGRPKETIALDRRGVKKGLEAISEVILKLNQHHPKEKLTPTKHKGRINNYVPGSVHAIIEGGGCATLTLCKDGTTDDVSLVLSNADDERVVQMARKYCKATTLSTYKSEWIRTSSIYDFSFSSHSNHLEPSSNEYEYEYEYASVNADEVFRSKNNMLVLYAPNWRNELAREMYHAYDTKVKVDRLTYHAIIPADQQRRFSAGNPNPEALKRLRARLEVKWDTHLKYAVAIVRHLAKQKVVLDKRDIKSFQIEDDMVDLVNEVYSEKYASVGIFDEAV